MSLREPLVPARVCVQSGGSGFAARGLIPRTISYVFKRLEARGDDASNCSVRVSYLEIYNEQLFDLLAGQEDAAPDLAVFEDKLGAPRPFSPFHLALVGVLARVATWDSGVLLQA